MLAVLEKIQQCCSRDTVSVESVVDLVIHLVKEHGKQVVQNHQLDMYKHINKIGKFDSKDKEMFWIALYILVGSDDCKIDNISSFDFVDRNKKCTLQHFFGCKEEEFDFEHMCRNPECCGCTLLSGNFTVGCCCNYETSPSVCSVCSGDKRVDYNSDTSYFLWKHGCKCVLKDIEVIPTFSKKKKKLVTNSEGWSTLAAK